MVLTLYGSPLSTCCQRVLTVMKEKGLEYQLIRIDLTKGEHKDAGYMKKQPFGQIPYLDDDGFIVYESRAICRYLALKHAGQGESLIPSQTDLKALAIFEQAASVELCHFDAYASKLVREKVFKKWYKLEPNEEVAAGLKAELEKRLDVYETILSQQSYIAGNEFTLADIFHIPYGAMLVQADAGELITKRKNVKAWWDRITGRDSWKAVTSAP
ncbi:MAG: hypothetical protein M1840_009175 [Geoglossum simile]|nr:MAG: hypothetical protein M1840_009175 [Geoglossum simile]